MAAESTSGGENNTRAAAIFRRARALRLRRDWSQPHLADLMCERGHPIDRSIVANMEAGRVQSISIDRAFALADIFGISLDQLMTEPRCSACDDQPPGGFRCLACGAERAVDPMEASLGAGEEFRP